MSEPLTFTVTGSIGGVSQTLEWVEGQGFVGDGVALAEVRDVIASRVRVCATPTGPCYDPADAPAHVALLTATRVFDETVRRVRVEGSAVAGAEEILTNLSWVPEGDVA